MKLLILSLVSSNALSTEWRCSDNDDVGEVEAAAVEALSSAKTLEVVLSDSLFVDMKYSDHYILNKFQE